MEISKRILAVIIFLSSSILCYSSLEPVKVAELTLKVPSLGTEEKFYGFAEGDEIILDFEELKGKDLKEFEVLEYPNNSKFMEFKIEKFTDKRIKVNTTGVYKFRFYNSSLGTRVCKIKIKRIPASEETAGFNTNVVWKTKFDTTYIPYTEDSIVGYDTLFYKEKVKEVVKTEHVEDMIMDKNQRVHSYWNPNPSSTYLKIDLPNNKKETYKEEKIIAWAYWIGVGEEASKAYAENVKTIGKITSTAASALLSPLAGLAVGVITELATPTNGEDIAYYFMGDYQNVQAFLNDQTFYQFDQGKGIAAYGKNTKQLKGPIYVGLHNDNQRLGLDVNVKVVVVKEVKHYEDKEYDKQKVTPRKVTVNKNKLDIKTSKVPVNEG